MSPDAAPGTTTNEPLTPAELAEDARLYRDTLNTLIEIGTALATALHQEAAAITLGAPGALAKRHQIAADFDRIARAVRRSILLVLSLSRPPRAPTAPPAAGEHARETLAEEPAERPDPEERPEPQEQPERLDRMDAPERADDLTARPFSAIVAEIARDLGVPVPELPTRAAPSAPKAAIHPLDPSQPGPAQGAPVATLPRRPDG